MNEFNDQAASQDLSVVSLVDGASAFDSLWAAFSTLLGEPTSSMRALQARICRELAARGATGDEVILRAGAMVALWGPKTVTLSSLLKHWSRFEGSISSIDEAALERFRTDERMRRLECDDSKVETDMTAADVMTASRKQIVRFVSDVETMHAKERSEKSARWLVDEIHVLGPDVHTLDDALLQIKRSPSKFPPAPKHVLSIVAEIHRRALTYAQPALAEGTFDVGNVTDSHYADVAGNHAARPTCSSPCCTDHRAPEEIAEHEARLRRRSR